MDKNTLKWQFGQLEYRNRLPEMAEEWVIPPPLQSGAANVLMNANRTSIPENAVLFLHAAGFGEALDIRPVTELVDEI